MQVQKADSYAESTYTCRCDFRVPRRLTILDRSPNKISVGGPEEDDGEPEEDVQVQVITQRRSWEVSTANA